MALLFHVNVIGLQQIVQHQMMHRKEDGHGEDGHREQKIIDPAMFGGFLAIDMGGYQLAKSLESSPLVGSYAGIIVAATFGCTLVFTLPVGMGVIDREDRSFFAEGLMIGLVTLPLGLVLGAVLCGMSLSDAIWQNVPVFFLSLFLGIGLKRIPARMIRGFSLFAAGLKAITTIGLVLGAVTYLTGLTILPNLSPIQDALAVVASIGITMLGSLPAAEFLQRILRRPFAWLGAKLGINAFSMVGLLVGAVSVLPQLAMMKDMDRSRTTREDSLTVTRPQETPASPL